MVTVDLGAGGGLTDTPTDIEHVIGSDSDDMLTGDARPERHRRRPGGDTMHGGGGIDELNGGDGIDIMHGDADGDTLNGGADNDQLNGDAGRRHAQRRDRRRPAQRRHRQRPRSTAATTPTP